MPLKASRRIEGFGVESAQHFSEVAMPQRESDEFDALELQYAQGISAGQIVEFFAPRGVKLAQATFRKYVQLGLLPRSRRVGEKGSSARSFVPRRRTGGHA